MSPTKGRSYRSDYLGRGAKEGFYQLASGHWYASGRVISSVNTLPLLHHADVWAGAPAPFKPRRAADVSPGRQVGRDRHGLPQYFSKASFFSSVLNPQAVFMASEPFDQPLEEVLAEQAQRLKDVAPAPEPGEPSPWSPPRSRVLARPMSVPLQPPPVRSPRRSPPPSPSPSPSPSPAPDPPRAPTAPPAASYPEPDPHVTPEDSALPEASEEAPASAGESAGEPTLPAFGQRKGRRPADPPPPADPSPPASPRTGSPGGRASPGGRTSLGGCVSPGGPTSPRAGSPEPPGGMTNEGWSAFVATSAEFYHPSRELAAEIPRGWPERGYPDFAALPDRGALHLPGKMRWSPAQEGAWGAGRRSPQHGSPHAQPLRGSSYQMPARQPRGPEPAGAPGAGAGPSPAMAGSHRLHGQLAAMLRVQSAPASEPGGGLSASASSSSPSRASSPSKLQRSASAAAARSSRTPRDMIAGSKRASRQLAAWWAVAGEPSGGGRGGGAEAGRAASAAGSRSQGLHSSTSGRSSIMASSATSGRSQYGSSVSERGPSADAARVVPVVLSASAVPGAAVAPLAPELMRGPGSPSAEAASAADGESATGGGQKVRRSVSVKRQSVFEPPKDRPDVGPLGARAQPADIALDLAATPREAELPAGAEGAGASADVAATGDKDNDSRDWEAVADAEMKIGKELQQRAKTVEETMEAQRHMDAALDARQRSKGGQHVQYAPEDPGKPNRRHSASEKFTAAGARRHSAARKEQEERRAEAQEAPSEEQLASMQRGAAGAVEKATKVSQAARRFSQQAASAQDSVLQLAQAVAEGGHDRNRDADMYISSEITRESEAAAEAAAAAADAAKEARRQAAAAEHAAEEASAAVSTWQATARSDSLRLQTAEANASDQAGVLDAVEVRDRAERSKKMVRQSIAIQEAASSAAAAAWQLASESEKEALAAQKAAEDAEASAKKVQSAIL